MSTHLRHYRAIAASLLIAALLGTGCSASSSPEIRSSSGTTSSSAIRPAAQDQLRADLQAVTSAAAEGRLPDAQAALATLKIDLAAANAAGSITPNRFVEIRNAADAVDAELAQETAPPPSTTTVTVPLPAQPTTSDDNKHDGGDKKNDGGDRKDDGGGNGSSDNEGHGGGD